MKRLFIRVNRMISEPLTFIGKLKKFHPNQVYSILTARSLVKGDFKTIIDVGANYGYFLKPAKWLFPNANIYGFEPTCTFDTLLKIKGVKVFNWGLSDGDCAANIYYNEFSEGDSTFLKPTKQYIKEHGTPQTQDAILKRFDSLGIKIEHPCFVKIDTEGYEYKVIKGFGEMLEQVDVIQFEYHFIDYFEDRAKLSEIIAWLEAYGFTKFIQVEYHDKGCDLMFYR